MIFCFFRFGLVWIGSHRLEDRFPGALEARRRSQFVVRRTAEGTAPRTAHILQQILSPMRLFFVFIVYALNTLVNLDLSMFFLTECLLAVLPIRRVQIAKNK